MDKKTVRLIFENFQKNNPSPATELVHSSVFELLIGVILSAQATDVSVNKATALLFPVANTPQSILALGEAGLIPYIQTIGLYRAKAKHIIQACQRLIDVFNGEVPCSREDLESLAGVGRKTANVVLSSAFGQSTIAVDTHVFRVANRSGMAQGKTPLSIENQLVKKIPVEFLKNANHWLVLHGRYTCKARKPLCDSCFIRPYCALIHRLPSPLA